MSDPVSRETASLGTPPPAAATLLAPDQLGLAERYARRLVTDGTDRGLIGPRERDRVWQRHLLNCLVLEQLVPAEASVVDLGSGAGLPGVVLALARPDLSVTLVEPLLRRTRFLEEVVDDLGLGNCVVRRARAEELHGTATYDVVTARALAPLGRLLGWAMPLVNRSGVLLAMKGASVHEEVETAAVELRELGCAPPTVHTLGAGLVEPPTTVVRVVREAAAQVG